MRHIVVSLLIIAITLVSSTAPAQQPAAEARSEAAFHVGNLDVLLALGLGGMLYPHVEPSIDVGVIPLSDDLSISVGGGADLGYCLLCEGVSLVNDDVDVTSFYLWPYARGLVHLGNLGGLLNKAQRDFTVDLYGGVMAGPSIYSFDVSSQTSDDSAGFTAITVIFGPVVGARMGLANNTFLLFAEFRPLLEIGYGSTTVTVDGTEYVVEDDYTRTTDATVGSDILIGVGFRI